MSRHFVRGDRPNWAWQGRCVWENGQYQHYTRWPKLDYVASNIHPLTEQVLEGLIQSGQWKEVCSDPDLEVDDGL